MNRQIVSSLRVVRIQEDYEFTIYSVPSREEETGTSWKEKSRRNWQSFESIFIR